MKVSVCIPVRNAEYWLESLLHTLGEQEFGPETELEIIVADSSSTDRTVDICRVFGIEPLSVRSGEFDHGGTRTLMAQYASGEFLVFLTQDALPSTRDAIAQLIKPFEDSKVAAVCGRQLPHPGAGPFGSHLRLFNYPAESSVRSWAERERFGVKTIFLSDSFAAYRRSALESIGWFPMGLLFGEDSLVCAKFIYGGYRVAYQAEARAYHSHDYLLAQDFRRYFDVGVFHAREAWAFAPLPKAEGEGLRFVLSEWKYLWGGRYWGCLAQSPVRVLVKLLGYRLGKLYRYLPRWLILRVTMVPAWWETQWRKS